MTQEVLKLALEWFKCYADHSMSRNNAEALADEVVEAIEKALAKEKALQALHNENERLGLYKDAYAQPAPLHPDSSRIDWLTNNPLDALDIFGHVKGADAVRWIRQEIDHAISSKEEGK